MALDSSGQQEVKAHTFSEPPPPQERIVVAVASFPLQWKQQNDATDKNCHAPPTPSVLCYAPTAPLILQINLSHIF